MSVKPRVIGVIPSRYASQRLPAKPLVDLMGKPMVQRVYERASQATLLDAVIVATDDERIADAVERFGGRVIMTSTEIKSGSDRVAAVAEVEQGDIYVNIQGDEPLIAPEMINESVRLLLDDVSIPVGTLARRIESISDLQNPSIVKVVFGRDGKALYFSRSPIPFVRDAAGTQDWLASQSFYKHIGLYVYRREFLRHYTTLQETPLERAERLEQLRMLEHGYQIKVGVTEFESIAVDTPEDVKRVINLIQSGVN